MTTSSTHPAALPHLLGNLASERIPLTKAAYLWAMFAPELPDIPVPADVAERIPDTLPGELPQTYRQLLDAIEPR